MVIMTILELYVIQIQIKDLLPDVVFLLVVI